MHAVAPFASHSGGPFPPFPRIKLFLPPAPTRNWPGGLEISISVVILPGQPVTNPVASGSCAAPRARALPANVVG